VSITTRESRPFPRKKRRFQVRYTDEKGLSRIGFTHDMSLSGIFVTAGSLPSIGQNLSVDLEGPGGSTIRVVGRVVRQKRAPLALSGTVPNGFGLGLTGSFEEYERLVSAL
jgi:PilZ domain-containing protein